MRGIKRGTVFCPPDVRKMLMGLSKAALADIACNLALLGTDESEREVLIRLCREARIVCEARGDRFQTKYGDIADQRIDADPTAD